MDASVDRVAQSWGSRTPYGRHEPCPTRVDTFLEEGVEPGAVERWVQAASILHSGGDARDVAVVDGRMVGVRGRAVHRVNHGRPGPKDLFGRQANASADRLTRPLVRRGGRLGERDWATGAPVERGGPRRVGGGVRLRRGHARPGGGRLVEVSTSRGPVRGRLRVTDIRPGLLLVPFHYGYRDTTASHGPDGDAPGRAANETTVTDWDPASEQPLFKTAAAALRRVERGDGRLPPAPTATACAPAVADAVPGHERRPVRAGRRVGRGLPGRPRGGHRVNGVNLVLRALHHGEKHLAKELTTVAERHRTDHKVHHVATDLAEWSREHVQRLADTGHDRGASLGDRPEAHSSGLLSAFRGKAAEALGRRPEPAQLLLRDLRDLHLGAARNSLYWEMLARAARAARAAQATEDDQILAPACACHPQTLRHMRWTEVLTRGGTWNRC